jgi:hypothetical protein
MEQEHGSALIEPTREYCARVNHFVSFMFTGDSAW